MEKDYISVVYDEKRVPRTDYPAKLAFYLFDRFGLKKGERLLELGCGRGEFLNEFANLGLDCYGVDISEYSKDVSSFKFHKIDLAKDRLPFPENYFDVVYHKSLLEHFYSPEHLTKETYRVLKPGGRVIILTPDWVSQMKVFYEDFTHSRPYDTTALSDLLKIYGFSDVQTEIFHQLPLVWGNPIIKLYCAILQKIISTSTARKLSNITGITFFRWAVELMILGTGVKQ